jgi:zinc/manganese transport system substrate-binding protein
MIARSVFVALMGLLSAAPAFAEPVKVVAAENVYGDVAGQIGGANVAVTSILANPDQDPHEFEASPETARELARAAVVIANGAGYDPWVERLLADGQGDSRRLIRVASIVGRSLGDNPHLWYDPTYMKAAAGALEAHLADADPAHAADYAKGAERFYLSLKPLEARIEAMRKRFAHLPVTASEPVFGYMADLIGLEVRNQRFALAMMNDAEPSASDVAGFEDDLRGHKVRAMLYNVQADEPAVRRLLALAKASGVPIVAVSETEPPGLTYQAWMSGELGALEAALADKTSADKSP